MYEYAFGGVYYVDTSLRHECDRLLFQVRTLQSDLDAERISGAESLGVLKELQTKLERLQKDIEKKKMFVPIGKLVKQSETVQFDLGPERLLAVTAENIRVEGWDGPQVKCVMEKTVIAPDDKPVNEQFRSIKLVHRYGLAPRTVGKTPAEQKADEEEFLAGPEGRKLAEKERAIRRRKQDFLCDLYREFQGRKVDTVEIEGLEEQEGNRMINLTIKGRNTTMRETCMAGELQRHASLTVYIPACRAVLLEDGNKGVDVHGVRGDLLVCGWGRSWNRDYRIRDIGGSLTIYHFPFKSMSIESIRGSVRFPATMTDGYSWTTPSASYVGGQKGERLIPPPPAEVLTCKNVGGDFTASFLRADVHLETIAGRIDVKNDFGNTTFAADKPLVEKRHRVVSESGRIEVQVTAAALGRLPVQALTICGAVRTNAPYSVIEDAGLSGFASPSGAQATWGGMISHCSQKVGFFEICKFVRAIVEGEDDAPGLALINRSGVIHIGYQP